MEAAHVKELRECHIPEYPLCLQRSSARAPSLLCFGGGAAEQDGSRAPGVTAGGVACTGSLFGGFDGPFVTLFPESIHSPRNDDVHDRER
jgi:hypothetical protein